MLVLLALGCSNRVDLVHLDVGGVDRTYYEHVPPGVGDGAAAVFVLHGGGRSSSTAGRGMDRFTGFGERADLGGYVVIYPNSRFGNWSDGREVDGADVDDVAFFDALLDDVVARHGVDPARIGLVGISNGGFMTQRLLCERADRYLGGVSIVATIAEGLPCDPAVPVPVAWLVGTDDPLVPYEGGVVAGDRGRILSAEAARDAWLERDGCAGEPAVHAVPDVDEADGSTAEQQDWTDCAPGGRVSFVRIDGGGHTWPGASQYLPKGLIGPVNRDIDATEWSEVFLGL